MKNLFGKILAGTIGCVAALGISALAAPEIDITKVDILSADEGKVAITVAIKEATASPEATILVLPEGVSPADEFKDEDIRYIDQNTVTNDDGTYTFEFKLDTAKGKAFNVYCGGTDVANYDSSRTDDTGTGAGDGGIVFEDETGTANIIGKIVLPAGKYDDVTAVATAGENKTDGTVAEDGSYTIAVADGTYAVVVGKPGYLYKTYSDVAVAGADKDLGSITLIPGDFNVDDKVSLTDLTSFLSNYEEPEFDSMYDLNDDGKVTMTDLTLFLSGYEEKYE